MFTWQTFSERAHEETLEAAVVVLLAHWKSVVCQGILHVRWSAMAMKCELENLVVAGSEGEQWETIRET